MVSIKMANGTMFMYDCNFNEFRTTLEDAKDCRFLGITEFTNGIFSQSNVLLQINQISSITEIKWGGKGVSWKT